MANLRSARVFSKIGLIRSYNWKPVHPDNISKIAIIIPFRLFEFCYMPFDLKKETRALQRLMVKVSRGLDFVLVLCLSTLMTILLPAVLDRNTTHTSDSSSRGYMSMAWPLTLQSATLAPVP